MRHLRFWPQMTLVVGLATMNGGCLLIPEIKDRVVELAVSGVTVVEFVSSGSVNSIDETNTVNVLNDFNLAQVLGDAGIDVSSVTDVALSGVDYRVSVADPDPAREIVDGTITVARESRGPFPLVSGLVAGAGTTSGWQPAPLDPGGAAVSEINDMLNDMRTALPGSPPPAKTTLTYHITGQSLPLLSPTNFTWQLKLKIAITGTVKVSVPT